MGLMLLFVNMRSGRQAESRRGQAVGHPLMMISLDAT